MTNDSLLGGGYLRLPMSPAIGVVRLNFSVRNGKRWDPHAITTLSFTFQPKRRILHAARLCCLKKETIGGTLRTKTIMSRLELFTILVVLYRARPFCLYLPLTAPPLTGPRADRAKKAFG